MSILEKLKAHRAEQRLQLVSNPLYTKEYRLKYITSNSAFNIPYNGKYTINQQRFGKRS
jgi:hypothetical protein